MVRLYTVTTPAFDPLCEQWLIGTLRDSWKVDRIQWKRSFPPRDTVYGSERLGLRHYKVEKVLESLKANPGEIIVWADSDVVFFGPCEEAVQEALKKWDMAFISSMGEGDISPPTRPVVDTGYMAFRATPAVIEFWQQVMEEQIEMEPTTILYAEMVAVNRILMRNKEVSWGVFDDRFVAAGQMNPMPRDVLLFHARCSCSPIATDALNQRILATKRELLEEARRLQAKTARQLRWRILVLAEEDGDLLGECLRSIQAQQGVEFKCHVLLDGPDSRTAKQLSVVTQDRRFSATTSKERVGPLALLSAHLDEMPPRDDEVIVIIRGGDRCVDGRVLRKLEAVYQDPDVLMTYGNYLEGDPEIPFLRDGLLWDYRASWENRRTISEQWLVGANARPWSDDVVANSSYRQERAFNVAYPWSFLGSVWKQLPKRTSYQAAWEMELLYPLWEICGAHALFVRHRLVVHNGAKSPRDNHELYLKEAEEIRHQGVAAATV
jgi:hypothetical protein